MKICHCFCHCPVLKIHSEAALSYIEVIVRHVIGMGFFTSTESLVMERISHSLSGSAYWPEAKISDSYRTTLLGKKWIWYFLELHKGQG